MPVAEVDEVVNPVVIPEATVLTVDHAEAAPARDQAPTVVNLGDLRQTPSPRRRTRRRLPERVSCAGACVGVFGGVCCCLAVAGVILGGIILGCVYGILNQPNVNLKGNLVRVDGATLRANIHNTNPYKVTVEPLDVLVWLKAGNKRTLATFATDKSITIERYSGVRFDLHNSSYLEQDTVAKVKEKCEADGTAKIKVHGSAKIRQVNGIWTRSRKLVSQWEHAPCDTTIPDGWGALDSSNATTAPAGL